MSDSLYENKLKKELVLKLQEYFLLAAQLSELEDNFLNEQQEQVDDWFDSLSPEQIGQLEGGGEFTFDEEDNLDFEFPPERREFNYDFAGFSKESTDLLREFREVEKSVNALLIDCKFYPLIGLSDNERKLINKKKGLDGFAFAVAQPTVEEIKKYLNMKSIINNNDMKRRVDQIPILLPHYRFSPGVLRIYREVINCYINGTFQAVCALARSLVESIIKEYIRKRTGALEDIGDLNAALDFCKQRRILSDKVITYCHEIRKSGNSVLHGAILVSEEDALCTIKNLKKVIDAFFEPLGPANGR